MVAQKADFTGIYAQPDPRAYVRTLRSLDYAAPQHGCEVFGVVLDELRLTNESPVVLDLCCSYGINAAHLNHDVTLAELDDRYAGAVGWSVDELIERDREWFAARRRSGAVEVVGLDVSGPAIDYAVSVGLLGDGVVADLEHDRLPTHDAARIAGVDLVTITGGVGYVRQRTFDQVLSAADELPWVAALTVRWFDFRPIAEVLDAHGLVIEKLDGYVVAQRRFSDAEEERWVHAELASLGLAPTDVEAGGYHGAELYLARPAWHAVEKPIADLLGTVRSTA